MKDRGTGFSVLAAREMKREPINEGGGGGVEEEESGFLPFFPTLSSLFYLRHFSRGPGLSFLGLCSQTAPKRFLRRLERAHY